MTELTEGHTFKAYDGALSDLRLRAPVATDLRMILTISRVVNDLERAGDEAKKIARFALATARRMAGGPSPVMHRPLRQMTVLASESMRVAVNALDRGDGTRMQWGAERRRRLHSTRMVPALRYHAWQPSMQAGSAAYGTG